MGAKRVMKTVEIIEAVMGPLGLILATIMFSSSYPVLKDIISRKSVGAYSYFPYLVQVANCSLWVLYSIADYEGGKMLWPLLTNAVGIVIAGLTSLIFFSYAESNMKKKICLLSVPLIAAIYAYGIFAIVIRQRKLEHELADWEGTFCMVVNMIMYTGPLAGLAHAIKHNSIEFLPLSLGVSTLCCSTPWFLYGVAINNINIYLPNACGIIFGPVQIITYCCLASSSGNQRSAESLIPAEIEQSSSQESLKHSK